MKGKSFLIVLLALASMLLASFVACKAPTPTPTPTPMPTPAPMPIPASVSTPAPLPKLHVIAVGRLSYVNHRSLTFGTSGKISQVNVLEEDKVTNGQVLAKLDTTSLELAMRTAKIDLEIATDSYRKITYPYDYRTFSFDVPAAVALTSDVQRELDEAIEVMQKQGNSQEQYWDVFNRLKLAQEALTKARENLLRGYGQDVFETGFLRTTDFWTLRAAQLEMEKAQLDLDKTNDDLKKAVIVAPFDGVIAKVNVKEGDFLSTGSYATTVAIEIIDPSRMELDVMVNELDIPNLKLGQKVTISVDAFPDQRFEGMVTSICSWPDADSAVVSYEVKASFEAPNGLTVKAGMSAKADIIID